MNKLETEMIDAIRNDQEFTKDNTKVRFGRFNGNLEVYLHGNHIANVDPMGVVYINDTIISLNPSKTTVSRLKALGVNANLIGNSSAPIGISVDNFPVVSEDQCTQRAKI